MPFRRVLDSAEQRIRIRYGAVTNRLDSTGRHENIGSLFPALQDQVGFRRARLKR